MVRTWTSLNILGSYSELFLLACGGVTSVLALAADLAGVFLGLPLAAFSAPGGEGVTVPRAKLTSFLALAAAGAAALGATLLRGGFFGGRALATVA